MRGFWSAGCLAVALGVAWPAAGAVEFGARTDFWQSSLSGNVKAESPSIPATQLSFDALGMGTTPTIQTGEVFVRFGKTLGHRLSLRYWEQSYQGQTTLTQTVTFQTFSFPVSTTLFSRFALKDLDFRYEGDVWQEKLKPGVLRRPNAFWGILGAKSLTLSAQLFAVGVGNAEEGKTAPLPLVGLGGRWGWGRNFSLEAQASGLAVAVSSVSASFYEISASARWDFTPNIALEGGWRTWHLGGTINSTTTVNVSATIQGPFLGLEGRF